VSIPLRLRTWRGDRLARSDALPNFDSSYLIKKQTSHEPCSHQQSEPL